VGELSFSECHLSKKKAGDKHLDKIVLASC